MSRLESRAKPVLEPLLDDGPVGLGPAEQTTVAVWAIKSAMVFEALRVEQPWVFTDEERSLLRESLTIPPRTKVWIAKCVDSPGAFCAASDLSGMAEGFADRVHGYVTTMAFGPLAVQVLNFRLPTLAPVSADLTAELGPGPWSEVAIQIWPDPHLASWPAAMGLAGEAGLDTFSERWRPPPR